MELIVHLLIVRTFSGDHNAPISGRLMGEKKHKEKHHKREASKTEAQNAKDSGRKHTSRSHSKKESSTIAKESGSHGKSSKKKKEQVEKAAQVVLPKADTKSTIKESAKESKARAKEERKEKRKSKNLALHPAVTKPAGSGMSAGQGAASSNATLSASQHKETQLVVKTETSSPVKPVYELIDDALILAIDCGVEFVIHFLSHAVARQLRRVRLSLLTRLWIASAHSAMTIRRQSRPRSPPPPPTMRPAMPPSHPLARQPRTLARSQPLRAHPASRSTVSSHSQTKGPVR